MNVILTSEQFDWLVASGRFSDSNVTILKAHYVDRVGLKELAEKAGFESPSRIYTLAKKFELFIEKRLQDEGLQVSTILHDPSVLEHVMQFDVSKRELV